MRVAYQAACQCLPRYSNPFSRHDFTLAQLFACLVVREHMGCSYRKAEALLKDSTPWCRDIGMRKAPDHATLHRAFKCLIRGKWLERLLDVLHRWLMLLKKLGTTLAIDSTLYNTHHRSRHYEQRLRHQKDAKTSDKLRSTTAKRTPKLIIALDVKSHAIIAVRTRRGMGSDAPDFIPILDQALGRSRIKRVLADAGYDASGNHHHARRHKVQALIKTGAGRPTTKPPRCPHRRRMHKQLSGSQKGKPYGQRAQVETGMSMLKRNLGDALRCRSNGARRRELIFRTIVHDIMLIRRRSQGRDRAAASPFYVPKPKGVEQEHVHAIGYKERNIAVVNNEWEAFDAQDRYDRIKQSDIGLFCGRIPGPRANAGS